MSSIKRVPFGPGAVRVGNGPGYLIFSDEGNVYSYREGPAASGPTATKGLGAYKGASLRDDVASLALIPGLSKPEGTKDEEFIHLRNLAIAFMPVLDRLKAILTVGSKETAERLIDEFARDLKAARKLNYSDLVLNHPIDKGRKMAKGIHPHDQFVNAIVRLAKVKKRVPTKGEVGDELHFTWSHTSKLCKANGYAWLPTNPPGPKA